jgi:hypothetical protein
MDERDPAYDYDGGWAEGIDNGEGLAEHLLGPVDPYDRKDHYTPHPRFATHPEMRWIKAEDPIENLSTGQADTAPRGGRRPRNQGRPARTRESLRHQVVSNPVVTPAEAERLKRALRSSNRSQPPSSAQPRASGAEFSRSETRGERLARQKGHSNVEGITLRQAKALPDLRQAEARPGLKDQPTSGREQRKKRQGGRRPKKRAPDPARMASSSGTPKDQRRVKKARQARASFERSMQRARQERETRDRLLADMASRERWGAPFSQPLKSVAASVPKGVCRSCSRPISATGQCACS